MGGNPGRVKRWFEKALTDPRDVRMREACWARGLSYFGADRAPDPIEDLAFLGPKGLHRWANVAYGMYEGGVEKWFFDLNTTGDESGTAPQEDRPSTMDYIGGITTADRDWPTVTISDRRVRDRLADRLGLNERWETSAKTFDNRFRVQATHYGFTAELLDKHIRAVLLRLPSESVVTIRGAHVIIVAPRDSRLPLALEPIMDEFERKVPLIIDTWPSETEAP